MKSIRWVCVGITAAGLSLPLLLTTGAVAAPEIQQQGAVSFVSGGVGDSEMQEIKGLSSGYPVEMMFVAKSIPDRYLTDVKVQIKDNDGKVVLDTESQGPILLAKMPSGKYSISADSAGISKRQTIQVTGGKAQRVVFVWNGPVDQ